ncbi:hypothetical protein QA596_02820 [Balneolales bacterium ANBcel1]|nr:hypothetical protein [Balneolales bacterium ANBcel1]
MEKKPNMSSVDELCVKYVFDELDPSEITLVEHAMLEDQNLLIEVESLKSTWKKLKKIPELDPPENISAAIMEQAHEHARQQQLFGKNWSNPGLMATAAVVLFSLIISTAYLLPGDEAAGETAAAENSAHSVTTAGQVPSLFGSQDSPLISWENRANIIFVESPGNGGHQISADSLSGRLHGIDQRGMDQLIMTQPVQGIQLTGTDF